LDVYVEGPNSDLHISGRGNRNEFPGMEIYVERPETKNQSNELIYGYNPEDEGRGPFSLLLHEDFDVNGKRIPPK